MARTIELTSEYVAKVSDKDYSRVLTDERAIQAVKAALRWMKAHNVQWLKTEEKIYSRKYDFAGTLDGVAYVDSCLDSACCQEQYKHRLCLIDFKTSNHLSTGYCFQTAAYQQAVQEEYNSPIESRWVLRLGKSEEEAGKFEPWFLSNKDFVTDLDAFLACLNLTRLVDSVESRMKTQKGSIRAIRKEQKETAKMLAKEQEKLQKALDKAVAKKAKEEEKVRIKAEAKAERERLKAEKKTGVTHRVEVDQTVNLAVPVTIAGSIPAAPTITEVLELSPQAQAVVVEAVVNPPEPNEALKEAAVRYEEEEAISQPYHLPME